MDENTCKMISSMVKDKEEKVRELNGKARAAAFKSILDIVNVLSSQVKMMMKLKKEKENMLAEGKKQLAQMCPSLAPTPEAAKGGGRNKKTHKKYKRGGRGKSRRRRRKQKSKSRRTKRR